MIPSSLVDMLYTLYRKLRMPENVICCWLNLSPVLWY